MAIPVIVSALFFGSAVAAEDEISVPFDEVLRAEPGSIIEIANISVEDRLVGEVCSVSVNADNQASVHPGNSLVARSGDAEVVMEGIEDQANGKVVESQKIEIGQRIVVDLVMGPEGVSSLGFGVSILCNEDEPEVIQLLEESPAPKAEATADPCQSPSAATGSHTQKCCAESEIESEIESHATSFSSICCPTAASEPGSDTANGNATADATSAGSGTTCSETKVVAKPEVLSGLKEAPVAKSVASQPTYTG